MQTDTITTLSKRPFAPRPYTEDDTGCVEACCSLKTLVRPRFFCGQLLTDHDLTDLVHWTQDKQRLARAVQGWGVVCGLDVRCGPPGSVTVTTGHAVSCCGDDIIVPADVAFDFAPHCNGDRDPCEPLPRRSEDDQASSTDPEALFTGGYLQDVSPQGDPSELRVFDLAIRYCERGAEPVEALSRHVCGTGGACVDSRTREEFRLVATRVYGNENPVAEAARSWAEGYEACLAILTTFVKTFAATPTEPRGEYARKAGDWLRSWLDDHPLARFCFLRDMVCVLRDSGELAKPQVLEKLLLILVLDCRFGYVGCRCPECAEGHGVPLARVWLRASADQGGRCEVLAIDPTPPFRRPISSPCWPAPLGHVNAARVIGHRPDEACATLAGLGIATQPVQYNVPEDLERLAEDLRCSPFISCGATAQLRWVALGTPLGDRVIDVCPAAGNDVRGGTGQPLAASPANPGIGSRGLGSMF